jgi:type IV pilus assembly protein PilZ
VSAGDDRQERRRVERIRQRGRIRYEKDGEFRSVVVHNLSELGLFLECIDPFVPGDVLTLQSGRERPISLYARVIWVRTPEEATSDVPPGLGLDLIDPPAEWAPFVASIRERLNRVTAAAAPRYEARHPVRYESRAQFLTEYTENLSQGGMYLVTDQPLEPGSPIEAQLEIPGFDRPIELKGKVAYRLDPEKARETGRAAGVGVQFMELDPEARAHLRQYLRRLEVHRHRRERRFDDPVPEEGSLGDFLVPEILLELLNRRKTGALVLQREGVKKTVYLTDGSPVYVDSALPSEQLGQFLVRSGQIGAGVLEQAMAEMEETALPIGEVLLRIGVIDAATLSMAAVMNQEERLTNTFPWFDGRFRFDAGTDWPATVAVTPLRPYPVLLDGIRRWFEAPVVTAWSGIHEKTYLRSRFVPPDGMGLPDFVTPLLKRMMNPQRPDDLAANFEMPADELVSLAFGLLLCGWVEVVSNPAIRDEPPARKPEPVAAPVGPAPKPPAVPESIWAEAPPPPTEPVAAAPSPIEALRKLIRDDFDRLRVADFFELLRVGPDAAGDVLDDAYTAALSTYDEFKPQTVEDAALKLQCQQILGWLRLAYQTLSDPALRRLYLLRKDKRATTSLRSARTEVERPVFDSLNLLEKGDVAGAGKVLEEAVKKHPKNPIVRGYYGWALFLANRKENARKAADLLDKAIERDPSDPQLAFFRGGVHTFLKDWAQAERFFARAARLGFPKTKVAIAARDQARSRKMAERGEAGGTPKDELAALGIEMVED